MSIQFINRLKSIMKERKITQTELAKRTGIRQSSISDWLNDRYEPKQDKVYIIAKALNVSPAWLLGYDENIPTNEQSSNYYLDAETAEYAEMLRTRPEMRMLFSASRGISKEEMQEAVNYIEFIKSRNKK
jgi:CI-like repressor